MGANVDVSGPDFSRGVNLDEIPSGGMLAGRVGDEPVLLSAFDGQLFAVSGACTHYGAALGEGLVVDDSVRCPLHHACFSLRTGAALGAPAFDGLDRWQVEVDGARVFVRRRLAEASPEAPAATHRDLESIVIVGGGAAGFACADELRRLGYDGRLTMISADRDPPCDRPNLSKDYLAGTAPDEWIPLRPGSWYQDRAIQLRLDTEILELNAEDRRLHSSSGEVLSFDRLLLATGSEPNRLGAPGLDRENVFTLRSVEDARAIAARAKPGARAAVIGSSFIGLEAAAALRQRGVEVDVVALEHAPFDHLFGQEVGSFFRHLHESHGVRFHFGTAASSFDGRTVRLVNGGTVDADFVLVGIGVRPRTDLARAAGLAVENGVRVDAFLETDSAGIYAAGDIAAFPDPISGDRIRIEHWVVAQRQGQLAAANMLGARTPFRAVPFFWTEQYGVALRHVGRAPSWDEVRLNGDLAGGLFTARYYEEGVLLASASVGRDRENLEDERVLEGQLCGATAAPAEMAGTSAPECHPMAVQ